MNVNNEITSLKERLLYIDKTDDRHFIDKIVELYKRGVDEQTLQSIFWQRYEIEDWLRDKSLEGKDYTVLYKENEKGKFRLTTYKTEDVRQVWLSTLVGEDEDVTINMPTSFEEAHLLGMVGWCFCDNEGYWIQHTNPTSQDGCGETIYFIHNVLQENPDDYTTDMVKRDGSHEILNRKHHHLNALQYLRSVGDMANKLVPSTKRITESNTYKNMKNTIKLNEQQLRNVIAESIKNVLNEGQWDAIDAAYDFMWGEGSDERFDNSNGIKAYFKRPITLKWEVLFEKPDGKRYTQEVSSNVQYKLFMSRNTFMNLAKEKLKKQLSFFGKEYGKPISARTTSLYDNLGILKLGPNEIGGNINY